jgi:hypothetical protein
VAVARTTAYPIYGGPEKEEARMAGLFAAC